MNNQINLDLVELAKKHEIKRGIFMWLEKDDEGKWEKYRFVLVEPDVKEFVICQFADLFHKCMKVSKTMMDIMAHMAGHYLSDMAEMQYIEKLFRKPTVKKKVVN